MKILIALLVLLTVRAQAQTQKQLEQEDVREVRVSLGEAGLAYFIPSASFITGRRTFGDAPDEPALENFTGAELGAKLISASNHSRTLFIGLDLRQLLASDLETKLGLRLEWHALPNFSLAGSWFFGDTANARGRSYTGTSAALGGVYATRGVRYFAEVGFGSLRRGSGFIFLSDRPGDETLGTLAYSAGVEIPLVFRWPGSKIPGE